MDTALPPDRRAEALRRLAAVEAEKGVRVLFACESGRGRGDSPLPTATSTSASSTRVRLPICSRSTCRAT